MSTTPGKTNAEVHAFLVEHPEAIVLANDLDAHSLMGRLKELYERVTGRAALEVHDWHWQATALQNQLVAQKMSADEKEYSDGTPILRHPDPPADRGSAHAPDPAADDQGTAPRVAPAE
jgi:hypothetical protein